LKQLPHVMINLILYNQIPQASFQRPSIEQANRFKQILIMHGYKTIVRTTKGIDSSAACGMLNTKKIEINPPQ
jgi:23S rRNA (adenine2503-C2)-methyltransferase